MERERKAIKDALVMLRKYDLVLMTHPTFKTPNSTMHGKITPIIRRLNDALSN